LILWSARAHSGTKSLCRAFACMGICRERAWAQLFRRGVAAGLSGMIFCFAAGAASAQESTKASTKASTQAATKASTHAAAKVPAEAAAKPSTKAAVKASAKASPQAAAKASAGESLGPGIGKRIGKRIGKGIVARRIGATAAETFRQPARAGPMERARGLAGR